jgi:site-specific DNA-methyltransferase (adenine-specific)
VIYFGKTSRALASVKAGQNVSVQMIRDPRGVIEREKAAIGIFLTLARPTRPMTTEAAAAGVFAEHWFAGVPRLQIVTVEDAMRLRDRAVALPARRDDTFKRAAREEAPGRQGSLDF